MISEADQKGNHKQYGNNFRTWENTSENLLIAANHLASFRNSVDIVNLKVGDPKPDGLKVLNSELLLKGSSLECLFKALYLKMGKGELVSESGYVKIAGVSEHNLLDLADIFDLTFTIEERFVLNKLTLYTKMGRYPIPKNWYDNKIQNLPNGGKGSKLFWQYPSDDLIYEDIRQKIVFELNDK